VVFVILNTAWVYEVTIKLTVAITQLVLELQFQLFHKYYFSTKVFHNWNENYFGFLFKVEEKYNLIYFYRAQSIILDGIFTVIFFNK
jgi:hypothetical protein